MKDPSFPGALLFRPKACGPAAAIQGSTLVALCLNFRPNSGNPFAGPQRFANLAMLTSSSVSCTTSGRHARESHRHAGSLRPNFAGLSAGDDHVLLLPQLAMVKYHSFLPALSGCQHTGPHRDTYVSGPISNIKKRSSLMPCPFRFPFLDVPLSRCSDCPVSGHSGSRDIVDRNVQISCPGRGALLRSKSRQIWTLDTVWIVQNLVTPDTFADVAPRGGCDSSGEAP